MNENLTVVGTQFRHYNTLEDYICYNLKEVKSLVAKIEKRRALQEELKKAYALKSELEARLSGVNKDIEGIELNLKQL